MCFGGNKEAKRSREDAERARQEAKAAEAKRQADITAGQGQIDSAFSQFNDDYFKGYENAYSGNYIPQLDDQYGKAKDKLIAALAGRGTLESSVGAQQLADLDKTYNDERVAIGGRATDASSQLRSTIEGQKSDLYNYNSAAADPSGVSARATAEATALRAPQSYSPLGQVFASVLQPLMAYNSADQNALNPSLPWNQSPQLYSSPSSTGSGRVVR